jgi:hypothetical protein
MWLDPLEYASPAACRWRRPQERGATATDSTPSAQQIRARTQARRGGLYGRLNRRIA